MDHITRVISTLPLLPIMFNVSWEKAVLNYFFLNEWLALFLIHCPVAYYHLVHTDGVPGAYDPTCIYGFFPYVHTCFLQEFSEVDISSEDYYAKQRFELAFFTHRITCWL